MNNMSDDYIHVDQAVEVVFDNEWMSAEEIYDYIKMWSESDKEFLKEILPLIIKLKKELMLMMLVK